MGNHRNAGEEKKNHSNRKKRIKHKEGSLICRKVAPNSADKGESDPGLGGPPFPALIAPLGLQMLETWGPGRRTLKQKDSSLHVAEEVQGALQTCRRWFGWAGEGGPHVVMAHPDVVQAQTPH